MGPPMLDATTKKILRLLLPDQSADVRVAAAVVLGEVGPRDGELAEALGALLRDADASVRAAAIQAVGRLRIDKLLPLLLDRVKEGGPESELAAQSAARLGARGTHALQDLMGKVAPGLRRRIASALAAGGTTSGEGAAVDALLDSDPGVVEAATRSLIANVPSLSEAHRRGLADHLLELLGDKKTRLPLVSEAAVVRLLAALDDARAEAALWDRTLAPHAPEVRSAALQALGKWTAMPSKDRFKRLLACATDPDFRIAGPALMILKSLPITDKSATEWLPLLEAPDVAVRRLAIERVGDRDRPEVAAALASQLHHPDRALRDEALRRLAGLSQGRKALTDALLAAGSPDEAWFLARAQAPFVRDYPPAWRDELFRQACAQVEAADRRSDALLFLLRETDAPWLRDRIEERALALRKKKQYPTALVYLRLLTRDPACGAPVRMEAASCSLKVSGHDLTTDAIATDPALQQFARLVHSHEAELREFLQNTKWLEPEDLFYLGFAFAGKDGPERKFGGEVLRLLVERSPRSKLAQDAKRKLRSEGLT
jgi:hypothetical protein